MVPAPLVRAAHGDDAAVICDLRSAMFAELSHPPGAWTVQSQSLLPVMLQDGSVLAVVAEHAMQVVGFGLAFVDQRLPAPGRPHGVKAHVGALYIVPEYRGVGTGAAVMASLLDRLRRRGADQVELFASPDGHGLYASFGFTPTQAALQQLRLVHDDPTDG